MNDLYKTLLDEEYSQRPYEKMDLGEGMTLVNEVLYGYWKPRYIMDNEAQYAFEFMDAMKNLCTVTEDDIDFDSMKQLSDKGISRAHSLDAHFPTFIRKFENGVAEVSWQVNPDGMYYMDEDGYGMTDDEEETLYGFINRKGQVVVKFRFIKKDWNKLRQMREEAEKAVAK